MSSSNDHSLDIDKLMNDCCDNNQEMKFHAQREDDAQKWNVAKQMDRPILKELINEQSQYDVPLSSDMGRIVIRLRQDVRIPTDGENPIRFVLKFPKDMRDDGRGGGRSRESNQR